MTGLIYKDIVALRKQLSTLLLFLIVYGSFCVTGVFDFSILGALVAVFGLTIPMSSVALDDAAHWDRYAVATPAGRRGVVAGKYVFTLLVIVVSVAVAAGLMVCLSLAGLTETTLDDLVLIALSCGVLTLVLDAIILPFLLKYGAEKGRMAFYITIGLFTAAATVLAGMGFQIQGLTGGLWPLAVVAAVGFPVYAGNPFLSLSSTIIFLLICLYFWKSLTGVHEDEE